MKDLYQKFKMPIIIIALLAVAFIIYNMFFKSTEVNPSSGLVANPVATNDINSDFLPLLLKIQDIKFTPGFFNDSTYVTLKDFSQTIISEAEQRDDPFAPILGTSTSTASSSVEGLGFKVQTVSATSTGSKSQ